jgi:hypothetical protein
MAEMVEADLCGYEERSRRKAEAFQGFATLEPVQIRPIRRTLDMASTCRVEALDRGTTPPFGLLLASLAISNAISVILTGPDPR